MQTQLPQITPDEYRERLTKFLTESSRRLANNQPNVDPKWVELLNERQSYAPSLKYIIPVSEFPGYIMAYENRYVVKMVKPELLKLVDMTPDSNVSKDIVIHYLLQKTNWFNEFQNIPDARPMYDAVINGIQTPGSNPHVDYFRQRFGVSMCRFFDVTTVLPQGLTYRYNNSFIICYGTGKESPDFNYNFDVYFSTLIRLMKSDNTDADVVGILCNQLTNEVTAVREEGQLMQFDIHLVTRVREMFANNPKVVNDRINQHLTKVRNMQNVDVGMELAGCTISMLRQIVPDCEITALTPTEQERCSDFVRGSGNSS